MKAFWMVVLFSLLVPLEASAQIMTADGEAYNRSYAAEYLGDYQKALKEMDGLTTAAKKTYVFELRRAWLLYLSGQFADSAEGYRKAARLGGPRAIEASLGETLPLMALRRWADALAAAMKVLQVAPNHTVALARAAWCEYNLGRFSAAEAHYRAVIELYPGDLDTKSGLGWSLLKLGKKDAARKVFREILDVSPNHSSAREGWAASK